MTSQKQVLGKNSTSSAKSAVTKDPSATTSANDNTLGATSTITPPAQKPTKAKIAFGIATQDYRQTSQLTSVEQNLGMTLSTVSIYKQFGNSSNKNLDINDLSYIKSRGFKLLLAWEPWDPAKGNSQSTDYLKSIVGGGQDSYIKSFASSIKQFGGAVVLRFGHEMNGDWYPWGNRAPDYKLAYQHIHTMFANENVKNVTWMWSVNVGANPNELSNFYPGDSQVNIIGIDGFNFGTIQNFGGWQSFTTIFQPTYQFLVQKFSKPLMISETASAEFGGDKAAWVSSMLSNELPSKFPKIKEIIWFNLLKETDWRIDSSPSSLQAFKNYFKQ